MKEITIKILHPEDEALIVTILKAFEENGKISLGIAGQENDDTESFDKNDEEILGLLDRADREKGIPYEEVRKRFGL